MIRFIRFLTKIYTWLWLRRRQVSAGEYVRAMQREQRRK